MTAEPAAAGSYRAVATRSGDRWAITIPQLPGAFSQCKRLDQVEAMAREVIALMLDSDPADVEDIEIDAVRGVKTMPRRCRIVPELEAEGITAYRELLVGPYRVMFAIRDATVVVLTALDGRRDLAELLVERALRRDR